MPSIPNVSGKPRSVAQHRPTDAARKVGEVVLSSVDSAIESRWTASKERAQNLKGDSVDDKIKASQSSAGSPFERLS